MNPPSISSSGHSDGLGRRVIVFDREDGAMLEALHIRPELGAFEAVLRERIERLAAFEDERFARIRGLDRDPETGDLVVVSEFVPGSRLSDLLDVAQEAAQEGITPGVDVALGYLLEAMPGVAALHTALRVAHGAIAPARTVLTPAGQVVFLDTAFGQVLERLRFSRTRLWKEFGIAMPPAAGAPRFDPGSDITQVALNAVTLVLGRPLREREYPDALGSLMMEVVEVAQIRGSADFAGRVHRFLEKTLPLPGRRPYEHADQAAEDIRHIVGHEITVAGCRRALAEFIAETAAGLAASATAAYVVAEEQAPPIEPARPAAVINPESKVDLDALMAEMMETIDREEAAAHATTQPPPPNTRRETAPPPEDNLTESSSGARVYDFASHRNEHIDDFATALSDGLPEIDTPIAEPAASVEPESIAREALPPEPLPPEPVPAEVFIPEPVAFEPPVTEPAVAASVELDPVAAEPDPEPVAAESPRRKRHQRSVRARKDKLRSIAASLRSAISPQAKPAPAPPPPAPLIPGDRAATFELGGEDYSHGARAPIGFGPPPVNPAAVPAPPVAPFPSAFAPAALAPPARPIPMPKFPAAAGPGGYTGPATTVWSAPAATPEVTPTARQIGEPPASPVRPGQGQAVKPVPLAPIALQQPTSIRFKSDGPAIKVARPEPYRPEPDLYAAVPRIGRTESEEPRPFPWKLAVAVIVIVAVGVVVGRAYLPDRRPDDVDQTGATTTAPVTPSPKPSAKGLPSGATGHLDIQTQPAGARVLLDGQAAGETPLKLDVAPGRHVLTFVTASGSMKRNVRVDGGKSVSIDLPLFSGWVAIFAPVVLEVADGGKSIGSTDDGRLMLSPGRHELTLTNKELGYNGKETVEIDSGDVKSITVDPRAGVNFNAVPWAEVWIDGKKAGDTPLANAQVQIGVREVVFKNPEFGERHLTTTVRADTVGAVSVDFTKKQ